MAVSHKVSRKELLKEPDEFLTLSRRMIQHAIRYRRPITWGIGIVVALVVVIAGYRLIIYRAEQTAFTLLQQASGTYLNVLETQGPEAAKTATAAQFETLLRDYGNRTAGKMARILYAHICYENGEPDRAIALYKTALEDFRAHPAIMGQVLSGIGYAYEAKNDPATAAEYFEKVVQTDGSVLTDEALFQLGRLYGELGDLDRSRDAFARIIRDHPDSVYVPIAREKTAGESGQS